MKLTKRSFLALAMATAIVPAAQALGTDVAKAHVTTTIEELKALLRAPGTADSRAPGLLSIMERRANLPVLARFSAGRSWREMNDAQQQRFTNAFAQFVSRNYARRFDDYSGDPNITVGRTIDAGKKGVLVQTPIQPPSGPAVAVEWLVSDRSGRVEIVDLVIEGISMAATQRDEIAAMLQKRGGDIDALISDLESSS